MIRILVADRLPDEVLAKFDSKAFEVDREFSITSSQLLTRLNDYDAVVVRSRTKITAELLDAAPNLKLIVRAGVGLDNIDLDAARQAGVEVRNTPQAASISVSEHAFGLMLALTRHIPQANASMHAGKWLKKKYLGNQLAGKTLGIVGFGLIGQELAKRALAFEMGVLVYDVLEEPKRVARELGCEVVATVDEMVKLTDFLSLHVPYLESTHHLINSKRLKLMKPTAFLVNTSRGKVIDEQALIKALETNTIAGAALDVFTEEPPQNPALTELDHLVMTPHIASSTVETQRDAAFQVIREITSFFSSGE